MSLVAEEAYEPELVVVTIQEGSRQTGGDRNANRIKVRLSVYMMARRAAGSGKLGEVNIATPVCAVRIVGRLDIVAW